MTMSQRAALIGMCAIASYLVPCSLNAQTLELKTVGDEIDLSSGANLIQTLSPSVAYNSVDDEYMVVWLDGRNQNTTSNDIFAQRVSASGILKGGNTQLSHAPGSQSDPAVVHNTTRNEYLVAWKTQQAGFFNNGFGTRVSADGFPIGSDFFILGENSFGGDELSAAYNQATNEYLVTGRGSSILGRRISDTGSLLGDSEIVVNTTGVGAPNGHVAYNPNTNEYLATWADVVTRDLRGQRISSAGGLLGPVILISPSLGSSPPTRPDMAFDPGNDRYLVVFGAPALQDAIVGQFVSSSGQLIGSNFTIATNLPHFVSPEIAFSSVDDAFVLVWHEENFDLFQSDIIGQLVFGDGTLAPDPLVISSGTTLASFPSLAYNSSTGGFLVAWSTWQPDVVGRRVRIGEPSNQVPVAFAGFDQIVECESAAGTPVTLNGSGFDADDDQLTYLWTFDGDSVSDEQSFTAPLPRGMTTFDLVVNDGQVDSDPDAVTVTVEDTTAPELTVSLSPDVINANNHKLVGVTATVTAVDTCDVAPRIELLSVSSSDPDDGTGDGDTANDIQNAELGSDDTEFSVRAERAGTEDGRDYTVTYRATDTSGNFTDASATVTVPHDNSGS